MRIANPGEVILVLDQDERFQRDARRRLEMSGFRVLNAANKTDAELICKRYLGCIHLLVIDLDLAEADGISLALDLQALRPDMRLLCLSAHPKRTRIESWLRGGPPILKKPVPVTDLPEHVRHAMDKR